MAKLCRNESSRVLLCKDDFTSVVVTVEVVVVVTCDLVGVCVVVKVVISAGFVGGTVDISSPCCHNLSPFDP